MRRSRRGIWLPSGPATVALALTATAAPAGARADDQRVNVRAELGVEYDDNVHRVEQIAGTTTPPHVVGSPVARGVFGWSASDRLGGAQDVAFSVLAAAKVFAAPAARSEDVAVFDNAGSWRIATDARGKIGIGATYYEAVQTTDTETERALAGEARDFRSLVPTLRALRALGDSSSLSLALGYRWFVYKPLRDYDFKSPVLSADYRFSRENADGEADWEWTTSVSVELRRFAGDRLLPPVAGCVSDMCLGAPDPAGGRHEDQFFSGQIDVTRTGRVLAGAGYAIQWNRSNSYAQSLIRHVGTIRFTAPLPVGLYLAARAELVYVTYPGGIPLAVGPSGQANASIEDETRSQVRAELSRDLGRRLQLTARYSFYANALGRDVDGYRRQTATLSVVYTTD